jgi:hypothetical protein
MMPSKRLVLFLAVGAVWAACSSERPGLRPPDTGVGADDTGLSDVVSELVMREDAAMMGMDASDDHASSPDDAGVSSDGARDVIMPPRDAPSGPVDPRRARRIGTHERA